VHALPLRTPVRQALFRAEVTSDAGAVIGASDETAAHPSDSPVTPEDVAATIYTRLGIDPTTELRDGQDKPYTLAPGTPIKGLV